MTLVQALVYALVHGVTQFLPVSVETHLLILSEVLGWATPGAALMAALSIGSAAALLVFYRHDWASLVSSFLRVVLLRRKPMTLDERLPFYLLLTWAPYFLAAEPLREALSLSNPNLGQAALGLIVFSFPLAFAERLSRSNRSQLDWTWKTALWLGFAQLLAVLPGSDAMTLFWIAAMVVHYRREAAVKYAMLAAMPRILTSAVQLGSELNFSAPAAGSDLSWLSFALGIVVAFAGASLAIASWVRHAERRGVTPYWVYRVLIGVAAGGWFIWKMRG